MNGTIAIVAAMEEELEALLKQFHEYETISDPGVVFHRARHHGQELIIALSGVGKVNAACTMTLLLSTFDIGCVINIGSAGGLQDDQQTLDLVVPESVVYTDVDVTALGFKIGQMMGCPERFHADSSMIESVRMLETEGALPARCHYGLLGSGDSFICHENQVTAIKEAFGDEVLCVEMEGAAIAHICHRFKTPFLIIRSISDVACKEGNTALDFQAYLKEAAHRSATLCMDLIKALNARAMPSR